VNCAGCALRTGTCRSRTGITQHALHRAGAVIKFRNAPHRGADSHVRETAWPGPARANLVTLSQQNLAGLDTLAGSASQGARFGQDVEHIRRLKQELATQLAEASKDGALFDQLLKLSRSELRNVLPTAAPDVLLSRLLEELSVAQQKHSETLFRQSPDHPEAKAALKRITVLLGQIDERIDGIKKGWRVRMDARARNIEELQM
jgi:hypothetical protein